MYRTQDGGSTWTEAPLADWDSAADAMPLERRNGIHRATVDASRTIEWNHYGVRFLVDHDARRPSVTIVRTGPPAHETLIASRAVGGTTAYGVSKKHAYHSIDGGVHWFNVGDLPAEPTRVGFVNESQTTIESATGQYVSPDAGRFWSIRKNVAWDRSDLDRALGKNGESPIACVATSARGRLRVKYGHGEGAGYRRGQLDLAWDSKSQTFDGRPITLARAHEIAKKLADAASRQDEPVEGFISSMGATVWLSWQCDSGQDQTVRLSAEYTDGRYRRAVGVAAVATELAE